ncbi:hypothetical protein BDN70DRAFT_349874 [Pholiota conissans]|uniref:Uncharacterized protein n=1 Tax=Pholiota conissans TaxID=109636 RepID=A0A9P5ZBV6_9AGAR|nr:hypothetical protein BDN70DRAFT_349874 [Pholiota conissans]
MPLSIYMYTYPRKDASSGRALPNHWSFFIQTNAATNDGLEYQIHGAPGSFYYSGAEKAKLNKSAGLEIGTISSESLDAFAALLGTIAIDNSRAGTAWNSQDWALGAIKELFLRQWIWYDGATIKAWLEEETTMR